MDTISTEAKNLYHMGTVELSARLSGQDSYSYCHEGYELKLTRKDGKPLSEMEIRSVMSNLSPAVDGEDSLIGLVRKDI